MQVKLNFDPLSKEEVNRVRKMIDALPRRTGGDAANEETEEEYPKPGLHDRGGECYRNWIMWPNNSATLQTIGLVDKVLDILNGLRVVWEQEMDFSPVYNENYITQKYGNRTVVCNFLTFCPGADDLEFRPKILQTENADQLIEQAGWDVNYDDNQGRYIICLTEDEIDENNDALEQLIENAFLQYFD